MTVDFSCTFLSGFDPVTGATQTVTRTGLEFDIQLDCSNSSIYFPISNHKWSNGIRLFKDDTVRLDTWPDSPGVEILGALTSSCELKYCGIGPCDGDKDQRIHRFYSLTYKNPS